jgi:hypothetical protein
MSFNRTIYDTSSYKNNLTENVSTLQYVLSPYFHEHEYKGRHQLGLVSGTAVSHIKGNLVDLESDLRGQTRLITKCGTQGTYINNNSGFIENDKTEAIDTTLLHLPPIQSISYKQVPLPKWK